MKTNNWEEELKKLMGYTTNEEMASRMEFVSQDFRPFNKVCDFIEKNFVHKDEVKGVKPNMNIKCVDNAEGEEKLTLNKKYKVLNVRVQVKNDDGNEEYFNSDLFELKSLE